MKNNMVTMNHSFELDCNEKNLFKILTNYENLSKYLPRKLQKIEILEENENYTTISATILLKTLIKKEFSQKLKIEKKSEVKTIKYSSSLAQQKTDNLFIEVLDGHAKGTHITISLSTKNQKTLCHVDSDVKLSLKTVILLPILKAEYNSFVSGVFKKMDVGAKEIKV
tara:strand:+ start:189 stop:692 length:504 start_codon:yes stop_codon:yes gene_type:complete